MNLSHSLVDSWYSREPFISDVRSSNTKPTDSQVVFRNKTYPSATAALEAYIDEYLGHSNGRRRQYGKDCVADLLLMKVVGDTSSLPSVSMMSSSESQGRGGDGCSGIKMPESFARDSESSDSKKYEHSVGTSLYESTRDLDRILAESHHSLGGKGKHGWDTTHTTMDHPEPPNAVAFSSTHKPMSPAKTAAFTHADLQKIRSRVCDNASYRSFIDHSQVHRSALLSRSLDSLLSNRNDSDSTVQDSDDKYSFDGGRRPPSWIQDVDGEGDMDGTIVSGSMRHRRTTSHDKPSHAVNIAMSTPKQLASSYSPGRSRKDTSMDVFQVASPSGSVTGSTSNSAGMRLRHACLQSNNSPDTFDGRNAGFDSRLDYTVDNGTSHDTYFDSKSLSWSRMDDSSHIKTPTLREKPTDLSRSLNNVQMSPERRTPRLKRDGSPGKTVCFDFTPQEPSRKLPLVYDSTAPWLKDSQREAYLRRLENEIEDSPSSVAGDSVCSSTNWKACDALGMSLGICGDSTGEGTGEKQVPSVQQQVEPFSCSAQPEVGTFLEKIRHLLATPPPYDSRGSAPVPDTPTSEQILDGDRSWEKTSSKATPDYLRQLSDLTGTMDVDRIVAALLTSTGSTTQSGSMSQCDSLRPGTKEALKNILFAMQSTMATIPAMTASTPVTPTSQKQPSMAVQPEQRSLEQVRNLSDSITPESRQLLAARATQEAGGESLDRALVHLARLKELVENTKECLH